MGYFTGHKHSKESKTKMRLAKLGKKLSSEHCKKLSEAMKRIGSKPPSPKGRKWSSDQRKKASERHKENPTLGMLGKHHSLETRRKISSSQKGDKSKKWKGGLSGENKLIRGSVEYRLWREAVFNRDNYTCVFCGARNGNGKKIELAPDHIKPFSLFPELRFDVDNGRTLCRECHLQTETFGHRVAKLERSYFGTV